MIDGSKHLSHEYNWSLKKEMFRHLSKIPEIIFLLEQRTLHYSQVKKEFQKQVILQHHHNHFL